MVEGLRDVEGDVALLGISNQGLFLPLVAAARPVRRIVLINACIPRPGKSFREASRRERVYANAITRFLGWLSPGMSEVCRLKELPKTDYVYIAGELDDALRPEWEQWQAREFLHVEPVVIRGAGHADIVLDHIDAVVDAATRDLGPARQPAEAPARADSVQPPRAPVPTPGLGLVGILLGNLAPLAVFFGFHASGVSDTKALGLAWLVPILWTFGSSWAQRRINLPGLLGIVGYGSALFVSLYVGGGALPLKLYRAVVSTIVGLVCLGSVAVRRPIFVLLARRVAARGGRSAVVARINGPSAMHRRLVRLTLAVGILSLLNAALKTFLALTLSTGAFLVATSVLHFAIIASIVAGLIGWLLWRGGA